MLTVSCTAAPAGIPDLGRADVRAQAAVVPVQGRGVPTAGSIARLRAVGLPAATQLAPTAQKYVPTFQNDGTTLGIRSSRRPPS